MPGVESRDSEDSASTSFPPLPLQNMMYRCSIEYGEFSQSISTDKPESLKEWFETRLDAIKG